MSGNLDRGDRPYVLQISWLLGVIVIGLVLSFRSSNSLAAAYGIAVSGTMLVTTVLLAEVAGGRSPVVHVLDNLILLGHGTDAGNRWSQRLRFASAVAG